MAHLFRVIVAAALWLVMGSAAASITPTLGCAEPPPVGTSARAIWSAAGDPVQGCFGQYGGVTIVLDLPVSRSGSSCTLKFHCSNGSHQNSTYDYSVEMLCPANSTLSGGTCQCNSGFTESGGQCVDTNAAACAALAGISAGVKSWEAGAESGLPRQGDYSFCDGWNSTGGGKCIATATKDLCGVYSGRWVCQGMATYTGTRGTSCDGSGGLNDAGNAPKPEDGQVPDAPNQGEAAPSPCPMGQAPGEVNGQRVCAPMGTETPKEARDQSSGTSADGSSWRESSNTRCRDGKCTTDTTRCTKAAGGTTETCETTSTTQGHASLCASDKGKGSNACVGGGGDGTGSSFSGDCAGGFKAVSEDAVINAMAEETFRQNCKVNPKDAETQLAAQERLKTGDQTGDNPNNSSFSLSSGSFDTSDALHAGSSCISDKAITVYGGAAVTLPFSRACDSFPLLGTLLVALSFLTAGVIVMRG